MWSQLSHSRGKSTRRNGNTCSTHELCRNGLRDIADVLRLSDIADLGNAAENEELAPGDLGDMETVEAMVEGCDGIVHLGGQSYERPFEPVLNANIRGMFNLYEAARKHGCPRIFYASSVHAVGFQRRDAKLDASAVPMADSLYGASKVYGEQLAIAYHMKYGIETARVRIGSCLPEPETQRNLSTWLSHGDLLSLITTVFSAPYLGCPVIYGCSANSASWWDNREADYLGWSPKDSADDWRDRIEVQDRSGAATDDPAILYQGGDFAAQDIER